MFLNGFAGLFARGLPVLLSLPPPPPLRVPVPSVERQSLAPPSLPTWPSAPSSLPSVASAAPSRPWPQRQGTWGRYQSCQVAAAHWMTVPRARGPPPCAMLRCSRARWGSVCGAHCVGLSVWGSLCGAQCVGLSVWGSVCGAQCVGRDTAWLLRFGFTPT